MSKEKICGIYCIKNLINNRIYIGQSVDIEKRWQFHKWELNSNCHKNKYLQRSWNKYGKENFEFIVLEHCNISELNDKEIYWIDFYDSFNNGYNLTKGGDGNCGKKYTDDERAKISRPILQINLHGEIICRWFGITKAAETLNLSHRHIWNCANFKGTDKTCGGYIWVYEDEYVNFNINNYIDTRRKSIRQYTLDWCFVRSWESSESTKCMGYEPTTISLVCKGKFKQAYGFIWTYDDVDITQYIEWYNNHFNVKYIGQYDLNENLIKIWNTPLETEQDGFCAISVRETLRGNQRKHKNYIFKYISWKEYQIIRKENNYGAKYSKAI